MKKLNAQGACDHGSGSIGAVVCLIGAIRFGDLDRRTHRGQFLAVDSRNLTDAGPVGSIGLTRAPFAAETLNLEQELRAVANSAEDLARAHFVKVELAVSPGTSVRTDPMALQTVLHSLLGTAIRSASGGRVLVTALPLGSQMHIRIVDDGSGDDQSAREALVRDAGELIAMQGGSLVVEARPGQGTMVTIRLPLPAGTPNEITEPSPVPEMSEPVS